MPVRDRRPRPRRALPEDGIPLDLQEWFSGATSETPWNALLQPHYGQLRKHWDAWRKKHPRASPPDELIKSLGRRG